jgi:hypothetical protein
MQKSLTVITLLAGAVGVYAQGQLNWSDYVNAGADSFDITVWSPQVATPGTQLFGDGPSDVPAGTQTGYTGTPLGGSAVGSGPTGYGNGNNYSIALYAANGAGQPASALTAVTGASTTFSASGYAGSWDSAGGVVVTVGQVPVGGTGTFQLQAWYNGGGTLTYAQAVAAGDPAGSSALTDITLGSAIAAPVSLNPITSFSITSVPEPSTIALGVIGASTFLMRLRRKQ